MYAENVDNNNVIIYMLWYVVIAISSDFQVLSNQLTQRKPGYAESDS